MSVGVRGYAGFIPAETGGAGGGGGGSVTSVGIAFSVGLGAILSVSGSPVTTSGDMTLDWVSQVANKVLAGPTTGADAAPTFRSLVAADIPDLSSVYQPLDADLTAIAALSTTAFGRGLLTETNAGTARTTLGLGTIATQAANNVSITGGSITVITDLVVADGGTGVSTLTGIVKGNGTSAFSAAVAATDYVAPGATTTSGLTMATARLLGRTTASTGAIEEISVTSPLSLTGGALTTSMNTGRLIGRTTASTGVMEEITPNTTRFSLSGGALDLATVAKTHQFCWVVSSPAVGGVFGPRIPWGATVTRLGSFTDTGTVTFNIEERSSIGSSGTNILSSDQVSDTTGEETTSSFNLGTLTAGRYLHVDISAVASSPTQVTIWLEVTI